VEADQIIRRVMEIFQDRARNKGVSLSTDVDPTLPALDGDSDRLQQLLINLVDNALKYTPPEGRVLVRAHPAPGTNGEGHPTVEISVSDTGCGIPEKDIPRLTERFYRVDKARSRELGGTGLGLAIVKHIVQAHGGHLKIESRLQEGTTVRVFLPATKSSHRLKEILFLCKANACRSQMAEGFARRLAPKEVKVFSAGTHPAPIHPFTFQVMKEAGIDISDQRAKGIAEVPLEEVGLVVTLCGDATESCPAVRKGAELLHWPIPDPALARGSDESVLRVFREVRDEIHARVTQLFLAQRV
jgi:thioredoxin type arsenate reductase